MIISLIKGTFNDMIGKEYILTAVQIKSLEHLGKQALNGGTYSDSIGKTVLSTSIDAFPEKSMCPKNTCIFPLVFQLFLCIAL